ncbi:hypothetical protein P154DRAFT_582729 [Amniculicola lignicola CBS 123094]|uniref:Uncharacterized protein n=1 Tax=Amniculicola lignicola CBS 123094 TaxID=1392246 RepID=A0A6A5VUQ8_9PLEO|nr:hypothetical protein P154DRAFT_582729 [Amniculicola lignicola CBS 123094]
MAQIVRQQCLTSEKHVWAGHVESSMSDTSVAQDSSHDGLSKNREQVDAVSEDQMRDQDEDNDSDDGYPPGSRFVPPRSASRHLTYHLPTVVEEDEPPNDRNDNTNPPSANQ